jgi:hypothetical protein
MRLGVVNRSGVGFHDNCLAGVPKKLNADESHGHLISFACEGHNYRGGVTKFKTVKFAIIIRGRVGGYLDRGGN